MGRDYSKVRVSSRSLTTEFPQCTYRKMANETPHCPIYVETACAQACRCGCIGSQGNDETGCCVCGDKVSMVISVVIEVRSSRLGNRYRNCANGNCSDSCCCARKLTRSTFCSAIGIKRALPRRLQFWSTAGEHRRGFAAAFI